MGRCREWRTPRLWAWCFRVFFAALMPVAQRAVLAAMHVGLRDHRGGKNIMT
eukprot:GDKH01020121.1.p3 GENE.GDKH01020121.1~~GDKH01020121.1.p3  ORF type:complete len:52 (-),score=10.05 GDKH01020121.1:74-229(-)